MSDCLEKLPCSRLCSLPPEIQQKCGNSPEIQNTFWKTPKINPHTKSILLVGLSLKRYPLNDLVAIETLFLRKKFLNFAHVVLEEFSYKILSQKGVLQTHDKSSLKIYYFGLIIFEKISLECSSGPWDVILEEKFLNYPNGLFKMGWRKSLILRVQSKVYLYWYS